MTSNGTVSQAPDDSRLDQAIDELVRAIRSGNDTASSVVRLKTLVAQWREANQNLVLASLRAQVLQEEAETRSRQQNEFLAMLAHELRNPLAPIGNAATLLEKLSAVHPLVPQIQGVIRRQVGQMARLIDDLLDASRITSGRIRLDQQATTLSEVIDRSLEVAQPVIDSAHQRLTCRMPDKLPLPLNGDIVRLSQALSNLLINASKYTPDEGQITLTVDLHAGGYRILVKDNGIGIEAELLPHIFDLFRQGSRALDRSDGGLGIGLSVARRLIEMHDGSLRARSDGHGQGSEFEIWLPALDSTGLADGSVDDKHPARHSDRSLNILLIEDNTDAGETLRLLLELSGHQVASASDGRAGADMALTNQFDVIICDIGLPEMDGYGVMTCIRSHTASSKPVAIAMSGYGQPEDISRAMSVGFDHYLVKPVSMEPLLRILEDVAIPTSSTRC